MSGPKTLSISIFKEELKRIISLQSDIQLRLYKINDFLSSYNLQEKSLSLIEKILNEAEKFLKPFELSIETFPQNQKQKYEKIIEEKLKEGENISKKIDDVESYFDYINFHEGHLKILEDYKTETLKYIEEKAGGDSNKLKETKTNFENIFSKFEIVEFEDDFSQKCEFFKDEINSTVIESKNKMIDIKLKLIRNLISENGHQKQSETINKNIKSHFDEKSNQDIRKLSNEIIQIIYGFKSEILKNEYTNQYNTLINNRNKSLDKSEYESLLKELKKEEEVIRLREKLALLNKHILKMEKSLKMINTDERNELKKAKEQINILAGERNIFRYTENIKQIEDKIKEIYNNNYKNLLVRQNIIVSLRQLGYNTFEEGTVIDFDEENELFLKVPDQDNYLHLKIENNGNIAYNFYINDEINKLSQEDIEKKLEEMKTTCQNFLKTVEETGCKIKKIKEKKVSVENLLTIPDVKKNKIKTKRIYLEELKEKKKYLDK